MRGTVAYSFGIQMVALLIIMVTISSVSYGQSSSEDSSATVQQTSPRIHLLRHTEDWSFLSDSSRDFGALDPLKYIGIGGNAYVTVGGDLRLRFDSYTGTNYPTEPKEGGQAFLLKRYMAHADLHAGSRFRLFSQFTANYVAGLETPRPLDRNDIDVHQLFVDAVLFEQQNRQLKVRVGRQEVNYGQLVDMREGPNVRRSFDGARLFFKTNSWQIEGLLAHPVETDFGAFDDGWVTPDETLWDLRLAHPLQLGSELQPVPTTLYYLGVDRKEAEFEQGIGAETRHTIGLKMGAPPINTSGISVEGAVQFGEFNNHRISAWFATIESGYKLGNAPLEPRLGLLVRAVSGDRDPLNPDLQTFSAPYSSQRTGVQSGFIGVYANIYQLQPSVAVYPYKNMSISLIWASFWRQSIHDPAYTSAGFPLRTAPNSNDRLIGHVPKLSTHFQIGSYFQLKLRYEWLIGGPYLEASGTQTNAHYFAAGVTFKF